jgi:hypothetical protein
MERIKIFIIVRLQFINLNLCGLLLFPLGLLNRSVAFVVEFSSQFNLVFLCLFFESIFAIQLLLQQFVILSVMLLHMGCKFCFMSLFKGVNGFIIVFEFEYLLFKINAPFIKLLFDLL